LKIADLIEQIADYPMDNSKTKHRAISGLFNLALSINIRFNSNSRIQNTKLLKDLFSKNIRNSLKNVNLININSLESKIRFDFSGITFNNSVFNHYNLFWECNGDETTYFYDCKLSGLGQNKKSTKIPLVNFINCNNEDNTLDEAYAIDNEILENSIKKSKILLEGFSRIFYKNGKFSRMSEWMVSESHNFGKINSYGVKFKTLINLLLEMELIKIEKDKKYGDMKTFINPDYKEDILKFISEGKQTKKLIDIIESISKLM